MKNAAATIRATPWVDVAGVFVGGELAVVAGFVIRAAVGKEGSRATDCA
jgi:hypothetical protein